MLWIVPPTQQEVRLAAQFAYDFSIYYLKNKEEGCMGEMYLSKIASDLDLLWGSAKKQKAAAFQHESEILFSIARFGWLTSHQLAQLLWPTKNNGNDLARRTLKRLSEQSFLGFELMLDSPGGQIKAFYLKTKGMRRVLENEHFAQTIRHRKTKRKITDSRFQYHRMLSNQAIIDIRRNRIDIPIKGTQIVLMSEHEMSPFRSNINSHFGCIPDGLVKVGDVMLVLEVENSVRGPARHGSKLRKEGNKLEHWLPPYIERLHSRNYYSGHLDCFGHNGRYSDAKEIFICTSEKIFRSIWRKMNHLCGYNYNLKNEFIYYIVMQKKLWVDPFRVDNIKIIAHHSPQASILVDEGEIRTRSYKNKS